MKKMVVLVGIAWLCLLLATPVQAANDLLWVDGTDVRYGDAGMSPASDVQITFHLLPAGEGRISNVRDWGASPRPTRFRYQCQFAVAGTGQQGKAIELWAARSYNGTLMDGMSGLIDAALTGVEDRHNLMPIGQVLVDTGTANAAFVGSGMTPEIPWRWWSLVGWNTTSNTLSNKATRPSYCIFTPLYLRVVP